MTLPQTVPEMIRFARQRLNMSARALSISAGLSPSYVGKLESGEIDPSFRSFAKIAVVLNLTTAEIICCVLSDARHERQSSGAVA